jgi:hypothetical protein
MKQSSAEFRRCALRCLPSLVAAAVALAAPSLARPAPVPRSAPSQSDSEKSKKNEPPKTRLKIEITNPDGKPVGQASVYVRFNQSGGVFHKEKLAELDLKTNDDGTVKVPEIPQGKVMIQVIAKGWRTYGQWYDIEKEEQTVQIKLQPPPHWY